MSVVINLLPDLRQARLKDQRTRRLVTTVTIIICSVGVGVVAIMFFFGLGQRIVIDDLSKKIAAKHQQLLATDGLVAALTAQEHLDSLPLTWQQRVYFTKLFAAYGEGNPGSVVLRSLSVDSNNQLVVGGEAVDYVSISKLARSMEAQNIILGVNADEKNVPYFSEVSITSAVSSETGVSFTITAKLSTEVTSGK